MLDILKINISRFHHFCKVLTVFQVNIYQKVNNSLLSLTQKPIRNFCTWIFSLLAIRNHNWNGTKIGVVLLFSKKKSKKNSFSSFCQICEELPDSTGFFACKNSIYLTFLQNCPFPFIWNLFHHDQCLFGIKFLTFQKAVCFLWGTFFTKQQV